MPSFGTHSKHNLSSCDIRLQRLFNAVVEEVDCSVICGHRSKAEQRRAYQEGKSKLDWPDSSHNEFPSIATDVVPYPVDWKDIRAFYYLAGVVKTKAKEMGLRVRWGGDWDGDGSFKDQTFHDLPHWELLDD
jgi:peptidoglycan L-alanyl-D-glutamate endopeptidase CwlK